jgi:hypothetical protein
VDLQRFCLKFPAKQAQLEDQDETNLVYIFQEWIRDRALDGVLLDIADYRHVPEGPGVMLITHEINYAMDKGNGQLGLYAQRKVGESASHKEAILALVQAVAKFGKLLQADERMKGKISLEGGKFLYMSNDRLHAPNNEETFNALKPDLEAAARHLYPGKTVTVTRIENDPRDPLTVMVDTSESLDLPTLAQA